MDITRRQVSFHVRQEEEMRDRDEFVDAVKKSRELIESGEHSECPCTNTTCQWHGKCFECVLIHRVKKHHVPQCLQPILRDKIAGLAKTAELRTEDDRPPGEFWDYLHELEASKPK